MPDPDFSAGGPGTGPGGGGPFGSIDRDDPDFQNADAACREVFGSDLPVRVPGPGGGGSRSSGGGDS